MGRPRASRSSSSSTREGASAPAARAAVAAAGGTIVKENAKVGVATVRSGNGDFVADAAAARAIEGAAHNQSIGSVPDRVGADGEARSSTRRRPTSRRPSRRAARAATPGRRPAAGEEPLAGLQWDMQQIGATAAGSQRYEQGKGVRVGIIDTGVDGTHPDIAPNFDAGLSRNFTTDIPVDANGDEVDGPCEVPSCVDPANVDDNGHGTHVASTIASPVNRLGIAGVAPKATIVNLRAGQDSGYFFLQPSVDALTYAGDHGIDVVNMSYYVDPWLFNCADNPADSPEDQAEQRTIITAMQRALDYAHRHGVTLVSAAGNGATDYTKTIIDASSPDYRLGARRGAVRADDPARRASRCRPRATTCSRSAAPASRKRKAYYSDYGNGYVDLSAPGGDAYDTADNGRDVTKAVLAAYPKHLAEEAGELNPDGTPNVPNVVRNCRRRDVRVLPVPAGHVDGVAARRPASRPWPSGRWGLPDRRNGGKFAFPDVVELVLRATATDTACPTPPAFTYTRHVPQPDGTLQTVTATHVCEGTTAQQRVLRRRHHRRQAGGQGLLSDYAPAGWKSSIGFPEGSSIRICCPPGPLTMSLRNVRPAARRRSTSAAMSSTIRWMRFQPPGSGERPSGIGRPAELAGPLSSSRSRPRTTSANAGGALVRTVNPKWLGVEVDGGVDVVDDVADADEVVWHVQFASRVEER